MNAPPCTMEAGGEFPEAVHRFTQPTPRSAPIDPELAELARRLRHDSDNLRHRAWALPYGLRRHRLFKAAGDCELAASELDGMDEAAAADAELRTHDRSRRHG